MFITNVFQVELEFYLEKRLCTHFDHASKVNKNKNNSPPDHLFFYRLWYIEFFINPFLNIIYSFRLVVSRGRL